MLRFLRLEGERLLVGSNGAKRADDYSIGRFITEYISLQHFCERETLQGTCALSLRLFVSG